MFLLPITLLKESIPSKSRLLKTMEISDLIKAEISESFNLKLTNAIFEAYREAYSKCLDYPNHIARNMIGMLRWGEVHRVFHNIVSEFNEFDVEINSVNPGNWQYSEARTKSFIINIAHINEHTDYLKAKRESYIRDKAKNNPSGQFFFTQDHFAEMVCDDLDYASDYYYYLLITHGHGTFSDEGPDFIRYSFPDKDLRGFIHQENVFKSETNEIETVKPILKEDIFKIKKSD